MERRFGANSVMISGCFSLFGNRFLNDDGSLGTKFVPEAGDVTPGKGNLAFVALLRIIAVAVPAAWGR